MTTTIDVGSRPYTLAINATSTYLYAATPETKKVSIIDLATKNVVDTINLAVEPRDLALTSTDIYVVDYTANVYKIRLSDKALVATIAVGTMPYALAINSTNLFVSDNTDNTVSVINLANDNVTATITGFHNPRALVLNATDLYVANYSNDTVSRLRLDDLNGTRDTISVGANPYALAINSTKLYVANYTDNTVSTIDLVGGPPQAPIPVGNGPSALALNSTDLYVANTNGNTVSKISLNNATVTQFGGTFNVPRDIALTATDMYVANFGTTLVSRVPLANQAVCFLEGSQILTDEGYRAIEDLRVGDKVKTLYAGYKAIVMIGTSTIYNDATPARTREKLYVYPEGVVLTGGHSVLKEACTPEEFARIKKSFGKVYVTEGRIRLAAMDDDRASVYPVKGKFNIYNFALEAPHDNMNYGVYAGNGLLVESSFKYWLEKAMNVSPPISSGITNLPGSFVESV